jgi:multidrug efflux pump subunit AcrB
VWLTRLALRNPMLLLMLSLMTVLLGAAALRKMPVDLLPQLEVPMMDIATFMPGAGPEDIEKTITQPMERAVSTAPNVRRIDSMSRQGVSVVTVWMNYGVDMNVAQFDLQQRVSMAAAGLPPGIAPPYLTRFNVDDIPALWLAISSTELDETRLFDLADKTLEPQLARLPGVATTVITGGRPRQIQVRVDREQLTARRLSVLDVVDAVRTSSVLLPGASLRTGRLHYNVFSNNQIETLDDLRTLVVQGRGAAGGDLSRGGTVRLADVATVGDGAADPAEIVRVNGARGIIVRVQKQPGANTLEVVKAVRAAIPGLTGVPAAAKITVLYDQAGYIRASMESLLHEAAWGGLLTIVIILLFLGSFMATGIVTVAIPLSIVATVGLLHVLGQTLNMFTLGGIALAIGRLVDDSIVELENIGRHLERGSDRRRAVLAAAEEVAVPILVSTVTTIIVFLPLLSLGGVSRHVFPPMALTMSLSLAVSFLVSRTVTPLLCFALLEAHPRRPPRAGQGRWARLPRAVYIRMLQAVLRHRWRVLAGVLALFAGSLVLSARLRTEFLPDSDEAQISISLRGPIGTRVEETEKTVARIEAALMGAFGQGGTTRADGTPGMIGSIGSTIGVPAGFTAIFTFNSGPHAANMQVNLVGRSQRTMSDKEMVERMRPLLSQAAPGVMLSISTGGFVRRILNIGAAAPLELEVLGQDVEKATDYARAIMTAVRQARDGAGRPVVTDLRVSRELNHPELRVDVDRAGASALGISAEYVARTVVTGLVGSSQIVPVRFTDPATGYQYPIDVRFDAPFNSQVSDLSDIVLRSPAGAMVPLPAIARIHRDSSPVSIARRHMQRLVSLTGNVGPASDLGSATSRFRQALAALPPPPNIAVRMGGQAETQESSFRDLRWAVLAAVVLIYMVLAAQFQSFLDPLVILFSVPLGVSGVFLILWITGSTLNTNSYMGMILVAGIVVSNGVLLVDLSNVLLRGGQSVAGAAIEAACVRLRPIAMTSLCTVFGLIPMAMGLGEGAEANVSLALAVIGGLTVSTALTLFVIPAVYTLLPRRGSASPALDAGPDEVTGARWSAR